MYNLIPLTRTAPGQSGNIFQAKTVDTDVPDITSDNSRGTNKQMLVVFTWPPAKMTGEPEGLGLYGMVTPFGGD